MSKTILIILLAAFAACGDDNVTGPESRVTLDEALRQVFDHYCLTENETFQRSLLRDHENARFLMGDDAVAPLECRTAIAVP